MLLLRDRIKAGDITIDISSYNKRKEKFRLRVKEIIKYVAENAQCRSRIIGAYFGDSNIPSCNICDNCLRQKRILISKEEFDNIHHRILNTVKYEPLHSRELLLKLGGFKKEKAWKVIEFLEAENKIELDKSGWVRLK